MPLFPRIAGRCPYERRLDTVVVDDWCGMCRRPVVDLTTMSDAEKKRLFAGCGDDVPCVRYTLPVALAAATLAMTATGVAAREHRHAKHHAAPRPPVVAPVMIPTAGVPALPVQWEGDKQAPGEKAAAGRADPPRPNG